MVRIKPKTTIRMSLTGNCDSHSRSRISVRDVTSTIDEPVERGGTNEGLTPTETLMASLIGCTNVISNKIAHKMGLEIAHMDITLSSDFNRRGVTLAEEVDAPFSNIVLNIEVKTDATADQLDALKSDLQKFCPIAKVLRGSGITITENWTRVPL
ncbi:MAG: OsmC family protein [Alphaproteobacteria bacterium]|nr:OsmC family protein [Alphaproteobacteria bacterium]